VIMLYEGSQGERLKQVLKQERRSFDENVAILIGTEGGFSPPEVEKARQSGVITAGLGPRILRTETAGLVAASIILYEYGEIG